MKLISTTSLFVVIAAFVLAIGPLRAKQIEGAFVKSNYKQYTYLPLSFFVNSKDDMTISFSASTNSFIYLRSPEGRIYSSKEFDGENGSKIVVSSPSVGAWTAVVRVAGYSSSKYVFSVTAATDLREIDDENLKNQAIASVLKQEEIERLDAEEKRHAKAIQRLVEELTLPTFRADLLAKLQSSLPKPDDTEKALDAAKEREARLSHALKETENLESRDLVQSMILDAMKDANVEIDRVAERLSSDASLRATFALAKESIEAINGMHLELTQLEESIVQPKTNEELKDIRTRIGNLREALSRAERELTIKLINSEIVRDMTFGRLTILSNRFAYLRPMSKSNRFPSGFSIPTLGDSNITILLDGMGGNIDGFRNKQASGGFGNGSVDTDIWLPKFFPWPPPEASSRLIVSRKGIDLWLGDVKTLGDLNGKLNEILGSVGYTNVSYFGAPMGFAVVTQMEQTNESGVPYSGAARWALTGLAGGNFSVSSYLKWLFTSPPGYYRVIVFIISDKEFAYQLTKLKFMLVEQWSRDGLTILPRGVAAQPLSDDHHVAVLVYEFEKDSPSGDPNTHIPGRHTAKDHLASAGVVIK